MASHNALLLELYTGGDMSEYGDNPETTPNGDTCTNCGAPVAVKYRSAGTVYDCGTDSAKDDTSIACDYAASLRTELTEVRKERKDWMLRAAKAQAERDKYRQALKEIKALPEEGQRYSWTIAHRALDATNE